MISSDAFAGSTSVSAAITSDRQEDDLGVPQSTKITLGAAHAFDMGVILGASVEYSDTAFKDSATTNLEATLGYRLHVNDDLSLIGSVGLGGRFQSEGTGDDIAYYVLRAGADWDITDTVTWNAVAFRYRDGFKTSDDYLTPQLATGVSFKIDEHNSISTRVEYNWKDWTPNTVGFAVGFGHTF